MEEQITRPVFTDSIAVGGDRLTIDDFTRLEPHRVGSVDEGFEEWLAGKTWREIEEEVLRWAIARHGSVRKAAGALGRAPSAVAERVKRLGIRPRQSRA